MGRIVRLWVILVTAWSAVAVLGFWPQECAGSRIAEGSFVRDAEIEDFLWEIVTDLAGVAGIQRQDLSIHLLYSSEINAFASLAHNMVISTGLIGSVDTAGELAGVIAHELGHVANSHLVQRISSHNKNTTALIAGVTLGIATMLAGSGAAGVGIITATTDFLQKTDLHYARGHEASADQAAVRYFKALNWPVAHIKSMLNKLSEAEITHEDRHNRYMRTHPLSSERVSFVEQHAREQKNTEFPRRLEKKFARIKRKIHAFSHPPELLLNCVSRGRTASQAQAPGQAYTRAIALYRQKKYTAAAETLKSLTQQAPQDPYHHELLARIYFDSGNLSAAARHIKRAAVLKPENPVVHLGLAQICLQGANQKDLTEVFKSLKVVEQKEPFNPIVYHYYAIYYGKIGNKSAAALNLARKYLYAGDTKKAREQAQRALKLAPSPQTSSQAQDILHSIDQED